jgi:hypothetical protein
MVHIIEKLTNFQAAYIYLYLLHNYENVFMTLERNILGIEHLEGDFQNTTKMLIENERKLW